MDIILAVPLDEELASFIGKKSSSNSISFYNRKIDESVVIALFPSQEEEKIYGLAESLLISSQIALSTSIIDKRFGEALVAISLLDKKLLLTEENDINKMLLECGITNYSVVSKEELLNSVLRNFTKSEKEETVRVDLDKGFPVKGVGTIALGIVTKGVLKKHDKLYHSSGKQVIVRSIQSQDEDVESAAVGTRVGVSLKDISDDQIEKGDLLTEHPIKSSNRIAIAYRTTKVAKEKITEGTQYGIATNFSYTECVVKGLGDNQMILELKASLPIGAGDQLLLIRKEKPRIFASGIVKEVS